ncbi:hypothetical protein Tco_1383098 [Tanacetum coccineum]
MKKKDQISLDEELAFKLQAEEEEARLAREKAQREEEANIVAWDNVQEMIDVDYQMVQQMQAEEQEKLSVKERVNTFIDMDTELMEGSDTRTEGCSKRAGKDLQQESIKKQKPPSNVDYKIHKEGKKTYYQIIRVDGSSKMYLVYSHMLISFDREDLEALWKLVKAKNGSTRPDEGYERVL